MLSIQNLTHTYPNGVQALRNVSLEIPRGMFGLLGPNGAGKSSLMRTLATLQQPNSGHIRFGDLDLLRQPEALRRTLGYLPQDFGVYPRGSAYEMLDHLAVLKGITGKKDRKQVVESLLVETNLYEHRRKRLATFSGGMLQRFGIAQALIGNPQLIIVDEPTGGLDPEERNRFHNLLSEIGEDRVVILSTHIVDDVAQLCANMAILAKGQIVLQGTPSQLKNALQDQIWTKTIFKSELASCEAEHHVLSNHLSAGKTVVRVNAANHPGHPFRATEPQLADVYFSAISTRNPGRQQRVAATVQTKVK